MKHLFLFTIGPVQSFIAQARKTQDLAAGSKLLSDLVWKAILWLASKEKANQSKYIEANSIIFPHVETLGQKPITNFPNRFLAIINEEDTSKIQKTGNELKIWLEREFAETSTKEIFEKLPIQEDEPLVKTIENQLKNTLDIYWAAVPFDQSEFQTAHTRLEKIMAGIKSTRTFNQMSEKGRKCSVDGINNVVIFKKHPNRNKPAWINYTVPQPLILNSKSELKPKYISPGEGLSVVSFYKRIYKENTWKRSRKLGDKELELYRFPSTAEIATWDTIEKVDEKFYEQLKLLFNTDEQFLFEENLTDEQLNEYENKREQIIKAQQDISKTIEKEGLKLSPYYAILLFDADKMGEMLSGQHLSDPAKTLDFQKKLSKKLIGFARGAKNYVDGEDGKIPKGRTVYAGGDDFLCFINLNYLFQTLKELRIEFKKSVDGEIRSDLKPDTREFTFSAGIVIAHYKTPLHAVLAEVRKSEKAAKNKQLGDRNAFCITVMKKSGEINQAYTKWHADGEFVPDTLFWIIKKIQVGQLSPTFIRHLIQEFKPLADQNGALIYGANDALKSMFVKEFERLICKSCQEENEQLKKDASDKAKKLFEAFHDGEKRLIRFSALVQALQITVLIEREMNPVNTEKTIPA